MPSNRDPILDNLTLQLNSIIGIKKYKQTKKVMADYDMQFKEESLKTAGESVNIRVP